MDAPHSPGRVLILYLISTKPKSKQASNHEKIPTKLEDRRPFPSDFVQRIKYMLTVPKISYSFDDEHDERRPLVRMKATATLSWDENKKGESAPRRVCIGLLFDRIGSDTPDNDVYAVGDVAVTHLTVQSDTHGTFALPQMIPLASSEVEVAILNALRQHEFKRYVDLFMKATDTVPFKDSGLTLAEVEKLPPVRSTSGDMQGFNLCTDDLISTPSGAKIAPRYKGPKAMAMARQDRMQELESKLRASGEYP